MVLWRQVFLLLVLMFLGACASSTDNENPATTTPLPTPTVGLNQWLQLEEQYTRLQASQEALETLWRTLQSGGNVSCAYTLEIIVSPDGFDTNDVVEALFFQASTQLIEANELWDIECASPRTQVSSDVIDRGLNAALVAKTHLDSAAELLNFSTTQ